MKTSISIVGGKELADALNSLSDRVSKRVKREALMIAAEPIRKSMAAKAPRAPGAPDIADNIVIGSVTLRGEDNSQAAAVAVGPAKGFYYGYFIEFGTIYHSARAFVRPAFDEGVRRAIADISAALWTVLAGRGISRSASAPTSVDDSAFEAGGIGRGKASHGRKKPLGSLR